MNLFIIIDGNRRWSREQGREVTYGYTQVPKVLARIVATLRQQGISKVYFWCNSLRNLKRPKEQVNAFFENYLKVLDYQKVPGVRFFVHGNLELCPGNFKERFLKLQAATKNKKGFELHFYINYESTDDLARALAKVENRKVGNLKKVFTNMEEPPNIDIIVRPGARLGRRRLSGLSLFKSPDAEIVFLNKYFPAINSRDIKKILKVQPKIKINKGL